MTWRVSFPLLETACSQQACIWSGRARLGARPRSPARCRGHRLRARPRAAAKASLRFASHCEATLSSLSSSSSTLGNEASLSLGLGASSSSFPPPSAAGVGSDATAVDAFHAEGLEPTLTRHALLALAGGAGARGGVRTSRAGVPELQAAAASFWQGGLHQLHLSHPLQRGRTARPSEVCRAHMRMRGLANCHATVVCEACRRDVIAMTGVNLEATSSHVTGPLAAGQLVDQRD